MKDIRRPTLLLDFSDAPQGRQRKSDYFLHDLLTRHYDVQIVNDPDVLFFTHTGHRNRLYSCKKIFYTQERYLPDWKNCDAAFTSASATIPGSTISPALRPTGRERISCVRPALIRRKSCGRDPVSAPISTNTKTGRWLRKPVFLGLEPAQKGRCL